VTNILAKTEKHKPGAISLSIAQVEKQGEPRSKKMRAWVPSFKTKIQRSSVSPLADIPPHEYLARGWDANNEKWRSILWPALDKHFRVADLEGTVPVWTIPWKKDGSRHDGTNHGAAEGKVLNVAKVH
jgi:hypothetical protein